MPSPNFVASSVTSSTSNTNTAISLAKPTGVVVGDVMYAVINLGSATITVSTVPSGWSLLSGFPVNGNSHRIYVYWKIYAGEAGPYAFASSAGVQMGAVIYAYSGNDSTPTGAVSGAADATSDTTGVVPSITTTRADSTVLSIVGINSNSTTFTAAPANYLDRGGVGGKRIQMADRALSTSGTVTGNANWTISAAIASVGIHIEILSPASTGTVYTRSVGGALSFGGVVSREVGRTLAGSTAPTGAVKRATNRLVAGVINPAGTVAKNVGRLLSGGLGFSGLVQGVKTRLVNLGGSLGFSGGVKRAVQRPLAGSLSPSGAATKNVARPLAGGLSFAGALSSIKGRLVQLAGSLSFSGSVSRATSKKLGGALSPAGGVTRGIGRRITGGLSFSGVVAGGRSFLKSLAGVLTFQGTVRKGVGKTLGGSLSPQGGVTKRVGRKLTAALNLAGSTTRNIGRTLGGSLDLVGTGSGVNVGILRKILAPVTGRVQDTFSTFSDAVSGVLGSLSESIVRGRDGGADPTATDRDVGPKGSSDG